MRIPLNGKHPAAPAKGILATVKVKTCPSPSGQRQGPLSRQEATALGLAWKSVSEEKVCTEMPSGPRMRCGESPPFGVIVC